jgi:hypothetical protein
MELEFPDHVTKRTVNNLFTERCSRTFPSVATIVDVLFLQLGNERAPAGFASNESAELKLFARAGSSGCSTSQDILHLVKERSADERLMCANETLGAFSNANQTEVERIGENACQRVLAHEAVSFCSETEARHLTA